MAATVVGMSGADSPQYILMNHAPGEGWDQSNPSSVDCVTLFADVVSTVGAPAGRQIQIGVSLIVSLFQTDLLTLEKSIDTAMNCSAETNVPVFFALDGQNWWSGSGLSNWYDSSAPGFDPANVDNVERFGWATDSALKISWRDWGSQIRVAPSQNIHSKRVWDALTPRLNAVARRIARWQAALPADSVLFAGAKMGWESGIGYNAYYYPTGNSYQSRWPHNSSHDPKYSLNSSKGLAGGLMQLGFAAAQSSGWKTSGTIDQFDIGNLTHMYVANLTAAAVNAGLPSSKLFTHVGGTTFGLPAAAAITADSNPGWSFYHTVPALDIPVTQALQSSGRTTWAASEWYLHASDEEHWFSNFNSTLGYLDCRLLCVYNWESFSKAIGGIPAVRKLVSQAPKLAVNR